MFRYPAPYYPIPYGTGFNGTGYRNRRRPTYRRPRYPPLRSLENLKSQWTKAPIKTRRTTLQVCRKAVKFTVKTNEDDGHPVLHPKVGWCICTRKRNHPDVADSFKATYKFVREKNIKELVKLNLEGYELTFNNPVRTALFKAAAEAYKAQLKRGAEAAALLAKQ